MIISSTWEEQEEQEEHSNRGSAWRRNYLIWRCLMGEQAQRRLWEEGNHMLLYSAGDTYVAWNTHMPPRGRRKEEEEEHGDAISST